MSREAVTLDLADEQATMEIAAQFARSLNEQDFFGNKHAPVVIYLRGDLGAGKTTFTRGFLRACGYAGVVKSPTYTLVEPYSIAGFNLYHFDLYRLSDPEELEFTGVRDCFTDQAICLIEWPEKAYSALPEADIVCEICIEGSHRRLVSTPISSIGKRLMLRAIPE